MNIELIKDNVFLLNLSLHKSIITQDKIMIEFN